MQNKGSNTIPERVHVGVAHALRKFIAGAPRDRDTDREKGRNKDLTLGLIGGPYFSSWGPYFAFLREVKKINNILAWKHMEQRILSANFLFWDPYFAFFA